MFVKFTRRDGDFGHRRPICALKTLGVIRVSKYVVIDLIIVRSVISYYFQKTYTVEHNKTIYVMIKLILKSFFIYGHREKRLKYEDIKTINFLLQNCRPIRNKGWIGFIRFIQSNLI